ncbi:MAG: phage tail tape measure protein [Xanthomonadaceae bacterium]|nr:phage tail tape measure protein [Xanthomonadaceae bacterium]
MATKSIKTNIVIGGAMSSAFKSALSGTEGGLKRIGTAIADVERRQRLLARGIDTFGKMGRNVDGLRAQYAAAAKNVDTLRRAQERLANVQARIEANNARRAELGGKVRGAAATVGAIGAAVFFPVRQAVAFEDAMLGVAKQVEGARDKGGKLTAVYYAMRREIQGLGRELPLPTNQIADMVTAGARMGIVRDELTGFVRDTAKMATAFEIEPGEIADSMGKVAKIFRIPIPAIGELGDAINYLDDNAISKGSDIIRVMQGDLAGAASTMGLSAKNAAALASTFLTLGESADRADTAASGMLRQLQIAKMNPKRFQVGVEMIGMTAQQLQTGMIKDTQGTILDVLSRIKRLPQEQQMEAVTRLFGKDWGGAIAKLANGVDEYRKQLELANGAANRGSMSKEFQARMQTTTAQWQVMKNRIGEAAIAIGNALLPAIQRTMEVAGPMVSAFAKFAAANPGMIRGVVGAALALSTLRLAGLAVAYAFTAVKAPVLAVQGFFARFRAEGAIKALGKAGPGLLRLGGALRTVGAVIAGIGGGPIAAIVAGLTVAALVVRKYWQPIGAFLHGMFGGIGAAVGSAFRELVAAAAPLRPLWTAIGGAVSSVWNWFMRLLTPVNMTSEQLKAAGGAGATFGRVLTTNVVAAIKVVTWLVKGVVAIGSAIGTVAGMLRTAFVSAWSQVKAIVGPIVTWIHERIGVMAKLLAGIGNVARNLTPGSGAAAVPPVARRAPPAIPPMATARGGRTASRTNNTTIHVTQQPGEDGEALARRVAAHIDRRNAARERGRFVEAYP